jgi:hypothetical protein
VTKLENEQRVKFIRIESARLTARAAWNAYANGWQILPSAAAKTDGRTTENASSPASGVRVSYARQVTYGGALEVALYQTDLEACLRGSKYLNQHLEWLRRQRYAPPELLEMWETLSAVSCKYLSHEQIALTRTH